MPPYRQDVSTAPGPEPGTHGEDELIVRSLGLGIADGATLAAHEHPWHQLVYATRGVMVVSASGGCWVVPPERAVWIPSALSHGVRARGSVTMRTVYLRPEWWDASPDGIENATDCSRNAATVRHVSPLLRELILEVLRVGMLTSATAADLRLANVLRDQILETSVVPFSLPLPLDPRARRVMEAVMRDVAGRVTLAELAQGSGASSRTIERLFQKETGFTFGRWLQRAKALHALELLGSGSSVTAAGLAVGYDSTSAFIAMFKKVTGATPGAYLASGHPESRACDASTPFIW